MMFKFDTDDGILIPAGEADGEFEIEIEPGYMVAVIDTAFYTVVTVLTFDSEAERQSAILMSSVYDEGTTLRVYEVKVG